MMKQKHIMNRIKTNRVFNRKNNSIHEGLRTNDFTKTPRASEKARKKLTGYKHEEYASSFGISRREDCMMDKTNQKSYEKQDNGDAYSSYMDCSIDINEMQDYKIPKSIYLSTPNKSKSKS